LLVYFLFFLSGEFSLANGLRESQGAPFSEFSLQDFFTGLDTPFLSGDLNILAPAPLLLISLQGDEFSPSLIL